MSSCCNLKKNNHTTPGRAEGPVWPTFWGLSHVPFTLFARPSLLICRRSCSFVVDAVDVDTVMATRALVEVLSHYLLVSYSRMNCGLVLFLSVLTHQRAPCLCLRAVAKLDFFPFILYPAPLKRGRPSLIKRFSRARKNIGYVSFSSNVSLYHTDGLMSHSRCPCGDDEHCCCVIRGRLERVLT